MARVLLLQLDLQIILVAAEEAHGEQGEAVLSMLTPQPQQQIAAAVVAEHHSTTVPHILAQQVALAIA